MKTYTIKEKPSNTGSIHDLASDQYDRVIKFPKGAIYAVILASFYGDQYTTHQSEAATIRASEQAAEYSHRIIDSLGRRYTILDMALVAC